MKIKIILLLLLLFCGCVQEQQNQATTTISTSFEKIVQVLRAWGDYEVYALTEEDNEYFDHLLAVGMKAPKGSSGDDLKGQILAGFAAMYVVDKTYDAYAVEITNGASMLFIVEKRYLDQYSNEKISYEEFESHWQVNSNIDDKIESGLRNGLQNAGYNIESLNVSIDEDEVAVTCPHYLPEGTKCTGRKTIYAINVGVILLDDEEDEEVTKCLNDILSVFYDEYPEFYRYNVDVRSDGKEFKIDVEKTDVGRYWNREITSKELYRLGGVVKKGFKETEMDKISSALRSCDMDVIYVNTDKLRLFAPKLSIKNVTDCMKKAVESLYELYPKTEQAMVLVKTDKGRITTLYLTQEQGGSMEKIVSKEGDEYSVNINCYDGDPTYGGHGRCYDSDIQAELNTAW